jgi:L-fuculose-phosphate aldolase
MLSVARKPLPAILEEMIIFLGGGVDVADYAVANTEAVGANALEALKRKNAVLLANHGLVAVGRDMEKAVKAAQLVEKMAKVYWGANQIGKSHNVSSESVKKFNATFEKDYSTY